jgi:hypothetical protein
MAKHFNPLEKEFLIRTYRSNGRIKLVDFCIANNVSDGAFELLHFHLFVYDCNTLTNRELKNAQM